MFLIHVVPLKLPMDLETQHVRAGKGVDRSKMTSTSGDVPLCEISKIVVNAL